MDIIFRMLIAALFVLAVIYLAVQGLSPAA